MTFAARSTTRRDLAFFVCAVLALLPSIWSEASITGQDEYFLSFRTVLEMQERGEWLTPWVNGEIRLQKPPLLYWLMRGSFLVFGPNLFAARIWAVLAGAAFATFTAKLARHFAPDAFAPDAGEGAERTGDGLLAGLFALASAGVMIEARRAMFDLPVACLATMAFHYGARWWRSGRLASLLTAGLLLGLAGMTKGPVALWFFFAPCLAALLLRRTRAAGPRWHVLPATVVLLAVMLPWPLWVQFAHPGFWDVMATQADSREFGLGQLANVPKLVGSTLGLLVPWAVVIVCALWHAVRGEQSEAAGAERRTARWLVTWIGIGLLPFAFMNAFERYTIALTAPLAMLGAAWLERRTAAGQRLQLSIAIAMLGVPLLAFALFAFWFRFATWWPLTGLLLLVVAWRRARTPRPHARLVAGLSAAVFAVLLGAIYPALGINRLPDDLPADLATSPVATFGRPQPGLLSMRAGRSSVHLDAGEGLPARLAAFHGYLFVLDDDVAAVEGAAAEAAVPMQRIADFRSFYSRKAWLKFFRDGVRWPDFRDALAARSATTLAPRFIGYRLP